MSVAGRVFVHLPLPLQPPAALGQVTEDGGDWWRGDAEPRVPSVHAEPAPGAPPRSVSSQGVTGGIPLCVWKKNVQELRF